MQLKGIGSNLESERSYGQETSQVQRKGNPNNISPSDVNKMEKRNQIEKRNKTERRSTLEYVEENRSSDQETVRDEIINAIEKANDEFVIYDRKFEFSIHEKTNKISVKVIDTLTDDTIREIPPEKILDMIAGIWEVAGIIVDKKI